MTPDLPRFPSLRAPPRTSPVYRDRLGSARRLVAGYVDLARRQRFQSMSSTTARAALGDAMHGPVGRPTMTAECASGLCSDAHGRYPNQP